MGTAISDPLRVLARRLETIPRDGDDQPVIERIIELIQREDVDTLVLGMPKRSDGKVGDMEKRVKAFSKALQAQSGLRPIFQDERYSSCIANRIMTETGTRKDKKKQDVDRIAAEIILQSYLDQQRQGAL